MRSCRQNCLTLLRPLQGNLLPLVLALLAAQDAIAGDLDDLKTARLPAAAQREVDFIQDIQPILAKSCYACHGRQTQEAELRLDVKADAFKGSQNGPVIVANESAKSRLIQLVAGLDEEMGRMPPEGEGEPLSNDQVALLRAWIDQGAEWPDDADKLWSLQPIRGPAIPQVRAAKWVLNPIDAFILSRLEQEKVQPSPEADRATLLRRVYIDLIGLPPTPEQVRAFLADSRRDAYERAVDQLLESPHYGERWGRHWLDAARYADSDGYENDRTRLFAWRYRDWVIAAVNQDLPFDIFSIQQLAGDLLKPEDREFAANARIATGFHRNTPLNRENGVDPEEDRVKRTIDRTNTTGSVWLGLTVGCANCHDHKYDPISQQEFFQLYSFFNTLDEVNVSVQPEDMLAEVSDTTPRDVDDPASDNKPGDDKPAAEKAEASPPVSKKSKRQLAEELEAKNALLLAQVVQESAKGRETHIHERGDFLSLGALVEPNTPAELPSLVRRAERADRLDLARWLFLADNPLTARVAVNRVWQEHFSRGLVSTDADYGTQGERASHPQLLDWLACELRDNDWRWKPIHRLIVTSATYRQSSVARPELADRDPYNTWLARQNRSRVDAEIVRDLTLAVSGLLNPTVGGPSVFPPRSEIASAGAIAYNNRTQWVESQGPDRYRRGMYVWFQRTSPYPSLTTFDAPDSNLTCTRRERSNTPLQALTLLNDVAFIECAEAIAKRMMSDRSTDIDRRICQEFLACVSRECSDREAVVLRTLYDDVLRLRENQPAEEGEQAACRAVARAILNSDEFITRE